MEEENEQVLKDFTSSRLNAAAWSEEADRLVRKKNEIWNSNTAVFGYSKYSSMSFGRVEINENSGQYGLKDVQDGCDYPHSKGHIDACSDNSSIEGTLGSPLGPGYMHSQAHTSVGACSVKNEGNTSLIKKGPTSCLTTSENNATKSLQRQDRRSTVQSKGIEYNGSGGLSKEREEITTKPLNGTSIDKSRGSDQLHLRERLARVYEKVLVVDNISMARETVSMLTNQYRHRIYACDTEACLVLELHL